LLFIMLIVRLGYLQIIQGDEFKAEVERTESTMVRGNVPRGEIYDSKLRPLVVKMKLRIQLCIQEDQIQKLRTWHK
jgi:Cell division protein FtsI/penicillin-binding protein 2